MLLSPVGGNDAKNARFCCCCAAASPMETVFSCFSCFRGGQRCDSPKGRFRPKGREASKGPVHSSSRSPEFSFLFIYLVHLIPKNQRRPSSTLLPWTAWSGDGRRISESVFRGGV